MVPEDSQRKSNFDDENNNQIRVEEPVELLCADDPARVSNDAGLAINLQQLMNYRDESGLDRSEN